MSDNRSIPVRVFDITEPETKRDTTGLICYCNRCLRLRGRTEQTCAWCGRAFTFTRTSQYTCGRACGNKLAWHTRKLAIGYLPRRECLHKTEVTNDF